MEVTKNPPNNFPLKLNIAMHQVPLKALDPKSNQIVCCGLNQNIVRTAKNGVTRNYRGLAELTKCFEYDEIQTLSQSENPTGQLLARWQSVPGITVGKLLDLLIELQRFDILDDLAPSLTSRGRAFLRFLSEEEPVSPEATEAEQLAENMGLKFVSRSSWNAFQPLRRTRLVVSPTRVIFVHHSVFLKEDLHKTVQSLQSCKIIYYGHDDLDYNFLVGHDGTVFEGRGWDICGSHTRGYNYVAISIGLLGNFEENVPDKRMLDAVLKCIEFGISLGKIHPNHGIYPHCDASDTLSPGQFTLEAISSWPKFRALGPLPTPQQLREMNTWNDLNVEAALHVNTARIEEKDAHSPDESDVVRRKESNVVSNDGNSSDRPERNVLTEEQGRVKTDESDAVETEEKGQVKTDGSDAVKSQEQGQVNTDESDTVKTVESNEEQIEENNTFRNPGSDVVRHTENFRTKNKTNSNDTSKKYPEIFNNVYNGIANLTT